MTLPSLPPTAIAQLLKQHIKPVLLLGAGASVRSGIPTSDQLVDLIAKWGYCKTNDRVFDDPTLMRSDWWPWLQRQPWFRADLPLADHYPRAVEAVLKPQTNRREFYETVLRPGVPPSSGYSVLAKLLARKVIRTVLTTNFDQLLVTAAKSAPEVHAIDEIKTAEDFKIFSVDPLYPQVIYIHGSINHYTDQNLEKETERLNAALVDLLIPLLRDHPLIVVGYRGAEPSVMRHLLMEQYERCLGYRHGIYWCHRKDRRPYEESPLVNELLRLVGGNLQFVEIGGFDELMEALDLSLAELVSADEPTNARLAGRSRADVHDLQPTPSTIHDLNDALLKTKLIAYADAVRLPAPDVSTLPGLQNAAVERGLATFADHKCYATNGAVLLFAKGHDSQLPNARVEITLRGSLSWIADVLEQRTTSETDNEAEDTVRIAGDLWGQLERALDVLARVNKPFRLKGPTSYDAYPYPPLALKELLTNLLAHRDYSDSGPATILVTPKQITFENPGGLTEHVKRQLHHTDIQQAVVSAARGIKGYRNPVIADFFFSAGAMDKEGSGLPDVVTEAANNLNPVTFGPTNDNKRFVATISARPEALLIDTQTRTARSAQGELRYSPNLLEISAWPSFVWKLGTMMEAREFRGAAFADGAPFCVHEHWIWCFTDPDSPDASAVSATAISEEIYKVSCDILLDDARTAHAIPRLLNMALLRYLSSLGLLTRQEGGRIRAYFPATDGKPTEVAYRSIFKSTSRTVTKPIVSRSSGETIYWEHKSVGLRFERFGRSWYLSLIPSYVFTADGKDAPLRSDRIGPMTTRRAARDYNPTVLHDLVFWARILAKGAEPTFHIPLSADLQETDAAITINSMLPTVVFQEPVDANMADAVESEMSPDEQRELEATMEKIIEESRAEEVDDEPAPTGQ